MNDTSNRCNVNLKEFRNQLRAFINKRVSNREDVEDILQDVFIKAQTNVASLKNVKQCIPWVYQITRNTIIDYHNKNRKKYLNTEISEKLSDVSDNEAINPEEIIQGLKPFIEALPKKYRDALLAIDINGLTQKEYSEQQGISLACSKSRVQRGRKMVKERLMDCCTFNSDVYGNVFDYEEIKNHIYPIFFTINPIHYKNIKIIAHFLRPFWGIFRLQIKTNKKENKNDNISQCNRTDY